MKITKKDAKKIIGIFIIYKILIISVAYASWLVPEEITRRKHSDSLFDPFAQLDARAYLDIAKNGYNAEFNGTSNYGWYPLYPLLIRIFSFIGFELAAFLIANIFSFIAILLLYILVKDEFGEKVGKKSVFYLLFFPASFFLTVMYTESLFLALTLAIFLFAKESKWHFVGMLGFLASLTRPQGILLFVPMAYMYLKNEKKIKLNTLFLLLIPVGIFTLMAYQYLITGDALIQFYTQEKYVRGITFPWDSILIAIKGTINPQSTFDIVYNSFNIFVIAAMSFILYRSRKYIKKEYTIYFFLSLIFPLFSASIASMARFMSVTFPVFMALALESEDKKKENSINILYAASIILLIISTAYYANEEIKLFV